jgi:hypothetical protein
VKLSGEESKSDSLFPPLSLQKPAQHSSGTSPTLSKALTLPSSKHTTLSRLLSRPGAVHSGFDHFTDEELNQLGNSSAMSSKSNNGSGLGGAGENPITLEFKRVMCEFERRL